MAIAFVLINAELGGEQQILDQLKEIEGVKETHTVYGVYDIIVKLEADSLEKVNEVLRGKLRKLDKVRSTLTMVAVE